MILLQSSMFPNDIFKDCLLGSSNHRWLIWIKLVCIDIEGMALNTQFLFVIVDAVMNASWIDNEYFIALTPGYVRDGSVKESRIFTFQIPWVNESHEGTYACRPEGYRDDQVRTCQLVLTQSLLICFLILSPCLLLTCLAPFVFLFILL